MIAPLAVEEGPRRAALALHALDQQDRHWILRRLSQREREALEPLFVELVQLGIPADAELLRDLLVRPGDVADVAVKPPAIGDHAAGAVASFLRGEPPLLSAALIGGAAKPWRDALLEALGSALAEQVREQRDKPNAPALHAAVAAAVLRRMAAKPETSAPVNRGLWQRLRSRAHRRLV